MRPSLQHRVGWERLVIGTDRKTKAGDFNVAAGSKTSISCEFGAKCKGDGDPNVAL